jgi:hypothetical protein
MIKKQQRSFSILGSEGQNNQEEWFGKALYQEINCLQILNINGSHAQYRLFAYTLSFC